MLDSKRSRSGWPNSSPKIQRCRHHEASGFLNSGAADRPPMTLRLNLRGALSVQVMDKAYQDHRVFAELQRLMRFYEQLAMSVFSFATMGTKAICNMDTYVYSSMQGT